MEEEKAHRALGPEPDTSEDEPTMVVGWAGNSPRY